MQKIIISIAILHGCVISRCLSECIVLSDLKLSIFCPCVPQAYELLSSFWRKGLHRLAFSCLLHILFGSLTFYIILYADRRIRHSVDGEWSCMRFQIVSKCLNNSSMDLRYIIAAVNGSLRSRVDSALKFIKH